ncbi:serine/threonine-protein kinase fray2-like [Aphis gossypii]|uniref:serine/threonine-protein kinase fray2-like n=1 Tax=Aphis gossypii TaxID=80765 RepID=UPI002158D99B|nr:serine/threonine-protein kinase fray2-like [Aphis gossypii]
MERIRGNFLNEFQPIGHDTILQMKLEKRRQGEKESTTSFLAEIESLCRQVNNHMSEKDICGYILKGLKDNILQSISMQDNNSLKKLKENLKKYELMQFRIKNKKDDMSEYTEILNEQVLQLNLKTKDIEIENNELRRYSRDNSKDNNYNRDRSYSRERKKNYDSSRESSRDRSYDREDFITYKHRNDKDREIRGNYKQRSKNNNEEKRYSKYRQYSRENSRERVPGKYREDRYAKESERVTCYRCNERGHYADNCKMPKND